MNHITALKPLVLTFVGLTALTTSVLGGPPPKEEEPLLNPANGHSYLAVAAPSGGVEFGEAMLGALRRRHGAAKGILASITSAEENAWIVKNFPHAAADEYVIGGIQEPKSEEPAGGWRWVTNEPWSFTNWIPGEPNNIDGGEEVLQIKSGGRWNDAPFDGGFRGYLVEFFPTDVQITDFTVRKAKVKGGKTAKATLTLGAPPEEDGLLVQLSSESALFNGPATVDLKPGSTRTKVALKTRKTRTSTVITVTASFGGVTKDLQLKVLK